MPAEEQILAYRWMMLTWTTYGAWLPGDPRGFRTRRGRQYIPPPQRYAKPNEPAYSADEFERLYEWVKQRLDDAVRLGEEERKVVLERLMKLALDGGAVVAAVHVGQTHVHMVLFAEESDVAGLVKRLKGVTSRELGRCGMTGRVWARGYHCRRLRDEDVVGAVRYVLRHGCSGRSSDDVPC